MDKIPKEQYVQRFKTEMLRYATTFANGDSVADYADEIAPDYYDENDGDNTPEEDARADVDCWEPDGDE